LVGKFIETLLIKKLDGYNLVVELWIEGITNDVELISKNKRKFNPTIIASLMRICNLAELILRKRDVK